MFLFSWKQITGNSTIELDSVLMTDLISNNDDLIVISLSKQLHWYLQKLDWATNYYS